MTHTTIRSTLLATLTGVVLFAGTTHADTVTRRVTTNAAVPAPYSETTTTTTSTSDPAYVAPTVNPPIATTTTYSQTTTTTSDSYDDANEDGYYRHKPMHGTYASGTDAHGNTTQRYENRTYDDYNN